MIGLVGWQKLVKFFFFFTNLLPSKLVSAKHPVYSYVQRPGMDTRNKIQVSERDPGSLKRTLSGGVSEPSDPSHYPDLIGPPSPRALSRLSQSFKSRVMADNSDPAVQSEDREQYGIGSRAFRSSGSPARTASPSGTQGSPKIPAERHTPSLNSSGGVPVDTTAATNERQQVGQICISGVICIIATSIELSVLILLLKAKCLQYCAQAL